MIIDRLQTSFPTVIELNQKQILMLVHKITWKDLFFQTIINP